jgi:hypothetical protein
MTAESEGGESEAREPQALGDVIRGVLGTGRMRSGVALGRLARAWDQVVGERLSARSIPVRLEGGGLVVSAASSSWAAQVTFLSEDIRRRANGVIGWEEVQSVRVVVDRDRRRAPDSPPWSPGGITPQ